MPPNLQPSTPTEGGRVFHELTESQLQTLVSSGQAGYATADQVQKQVSHNLDQDAYQTLRDVEISAIVFEFEVATASGQLPPPLTNANGAIGLSMIWLTADSSSFEHGPHMYLFARQGSQGPEAIGDAPTSENDITGALAAGHFTGDKPLKPKGWELIMTNVGVDAGEGRGILSGELSMTGHDSSILAWNVPDLLQGFVTDLTANNGGTDMVVERTKYKHFKWLLHLLGYLSPVESRSDDPPKHSFWHSGNRKLADWTGQSVAVSAKEKLVEYPSGEVLPIVTGPDDFNESNWIQSQKYWDPLDSRIPLVDTSGNLRGRFLTEDFMAADVARSGGRKGTLFTKSRIEPALMRFLQKFYEDVSDEATDDVVFRFTSGLRHWNHNVGVYAPKDPTRSEHCAGRGVDMRVVKTDFTIDQPKAWLRDDDTHAEITGDLPDDLDFLKSHSDVSRDGDNWKLQQGTDVTVVERDVGPDGQRVAKVKASGTVVGWTNRANFSGTLFPGFDLVDVGKIALNTPVNHSIEGVHPCDTRLGIHANDRYIHVDVKPRYREDWTGDGLWDYGTNVHRWSELVSERSTIDANHGDCDQHAIPPYDTKRIYTVTNSSAYLRGDGGGDDAPYEPDSDQNKPSDHTYYNTSKVLWDSGDSVWRLQHGIDVRVDGKATGPDGQTVVKTVTNDSSETVLGWTNLSNLRYWEGQH